MASGHGLLESLLSAAAESELVGAGPDALPGGLGTASPSRGGGSGSAGRGDAAGGANTTAPAQRPAKRRSRAAAAGRPVMATGARLRFTPQEKEVLARAVAENRGLPTKKSASGIKWAEIQRRAPTDYPSLMRHLRTASSKCLSKHWYQYGNPDDQPNKNRIWR